MWGPGLNITELSFKYLLKHCFIFVFVVAMAQGTAPPILKIFLNVHSASENEDFDE